MHKQDWATRKRQILLIGIVALGLFLFLYGIRSYSSQPISGDEPHYLLMDYSLEHDHDLDLKNNYQNLDYFRYYPAVTPDHVSPLNLKDPSSGWYTYHGIGLPLLLLPAFLWNERTGPVLAMTLIATVVLLLTWTWTWLLTGNKKISLLATGLLASCFFFNGLTGYIYPDLLTAGLLLMALIILQRFYNRVYWQVAFSCIMGAMVIIHGKSLSLVAPLGALMLYKNYKQTKKMPWAVVATGLPFAVIFFWMLHRWFGTFNPTGIYPSYLGVVSPLKSIPASLFDAKRGLLVYNPAVLLALVGLPLWFVKHKKSLLMVLITLGPAYLITMAFSEWWGGYAPPGRYLMDLLPAFVPAIAFCLLAARQTYQKALIVIVGMATLGVTVFATRIRMHYPGNETRALFFSELQKRLGIPFDKLLPHYTPATELVGSFGWVKVLLGISVVGICLWYGYWLAQNEPRPKHRKALKTKAA
jgi:hypothetical protein